MLSGVCLALARQVGAVSVVARDRRRLQELAARGAAAGGAMHPLAVDYRDTSALVAALRDAAGHWGPFGLVVAWIHRTAPAAPLAVARAAAADGGPCAFFHLLGSSSADPSRPDPDRRALFEALPGLTYHEVVLGFVRGPAGTRWLTHREICDGVLRAVAGQPQRAVVGTVEPWSARP
jgi:hypothetical protein